MHNITNNFDIGNCLLDLLMFFKMHCDVIFEMTANVGLSVQKDLLVP